MRRRILVAAALGGLALGSLLHFRVRADEPADRSAAEQAIRETTRNYLAALERGDTKALGGFWTADGDFVDVHGRKFPARDFIGTEEGEKAPRPRVKVINSSIRFLTGDVAVEDGTTELLEPDGRPSPARGRFTAIWKQEDGHWRLASLREARGEVVSTPADLAKLDWMVGNWEAQHGENTMDVSAHWNANHTFLEREFKIIKQGKPVFSGSQRIGFDPTAGRIRSWTFDADGGFGDQLWTPTSDGWIVSGVGVLPDGRRIASTNVFAPEGKDRINWKSYRATDDESSSTPEIDLTFTRQAPTP